ncbi:MAG: cell division/cell wall cluster transcriptional repressor MraZ [Pseudomonadota bacterium]
MAQWFRGSSVHKVDTKGRVSVPAPYRRVICAGDPDWTEGLQPNLVLVFGDEHRTYLEGYTINAMAKLEAEIDAMPMGAPEQLLLQEFYSNNAVDLAIDDSGRLVLSKDLRTKVGIEDEAQFVSAGSTFQIWNPIVYAARKTRMSDIHAKYRDENGEDFDPRTLLQDAKGQ